MNFKGKDFINLEDYTKEELLFLIDSASSLKAQFKAGGANTILKNKTLVMYFSKPSLRTRLSFEIGMKKLGGNVAVCKVTQGYRKSNRNSQKNTSNFLYICHFYILQIKKYLYFRSV